MWWCVALILRFFCISVFHLFLSFLLPISVSLSFIRFFVSFSVLFTHSLSFHSHFHFHVHFHFSFHPVVPLPTSPVHTSHQILFEFEFVPVFSVFVAVVVWVYDVCWAVLSLSLSPSLFRFLSFVLISLSVYAHVCLCHVFCSRSVCCLLSDVSVCCVWFVRAVRSFVRLVSRLINPGFVVCGGVSFTVPFRFVSYRFRRSFRSVMM